MCVCVLWWGRGTGRGEEVNLSLACHSQMLMARRLRTSIAVTEDMLKPLLYDPKGVLPKQKERQTKAIATARQNGGGTATWKSCFFMYLTQHILFVFFFLTFFCPFFIYRD